MGTKAIAINEFYDSFVERLLHDFAVCNARTKAAIEFALQQITKNDSRKILDVGCGIGWSSYEFSQIHEGINVTGLDLSRKLLDIADGMFLGKASLKYVCADLTLPNWERSCQAPFDACVLLDVYEHVAVQQRQQFHGALERLLTEDAIVVLSCPTHIHQERLRRENPEGLQPIDEDVTVHELHQFASDISGTITYFAHRDVWKRSDYLHAVIERTVRHGPRRTHSVRSVMGPSARLDRLARAAPFISPSAYKRISASVPTVGNRIRRKLFP